MTQLAEPGKRKEQDKADYRAFNPGEKMTVIVQNRLFSDLVDDGNFSDNGLTFAGNDKVINSWG